MVKRLTLTLALMVGLGLGPTRHLCIGAYAAAAKMQERRTPPGEWCQRPEAEMPKEAHACGCHKANCADPDPNKLPSHTDPQCLNYCFVDGCQCVIQDCV